MDSSDSARRMETLYYHGVKRTKVSSLHFIQKRRLTKLLEWVNNWKIHGSDSSLLCPLSYQGKVNILENEWIRRRGLPIFRRFQGRHNDRQQGRMFSQSSRSCVQKFEQCHKRSNFWKIAVSLSRIHSTPWQVAKIGHAQGQIQCSNTYTLFLCQNLFPSSYFLSWQRFLFQSLQKKQSS